MLNRGFRLRFSGSCALRSAGDCRVRGGDKKDGRKRRNENRTRRDGFDDAEETEPSAARTEPEEEKKEPTYDGGVMKKLNFVYRSEKKRRRLK